MKTLNRVHVIISSGGKMLNADVGDMIIVLNILNIRQPYLSTNDTSWELYLHDSRASFISLRAQFTPKKNYNWMQWTQEIIHSPDKYWNNMHLLDAKIKNPQIIQIRPAFLTLSKHEDLIGFSW